MSDEYEKKVPYTFIDLIKDTLGNGSDHEERVQKAKSNKSTTDDDDDDWLGDIEMWR